MSEYGRSIQSVYDGGDVRDTVDYGIQYGNYRSTGEISVWNDGRGLPIERMEEGEYTLLVCHALSPVREGQRIVSNTVKMIKNNQ